MKATYILFVLVSFSLLPNCNKIYSQQSNYYGGAKPAGISVSGVTFQDVWSNMNNQAGIAELTGICIGAGFHNEFAIKELSLKSFALALPVKNANVGVNYSYFGYSMYNESKAGIAVAHKLSKRVNAGIQLDYFNVSIGEGYGSKSSFTGEIGLIAEPVDNFFIGSHLFNPFGYSSNSEKEENDLPTIFRLGASYVFVNKLLLTFETEKTDWHKAEFSGGFEYKIVDMLFFRAGLRSKPVKYSFGLGVIFKTFSTDISFSRHEILGNSSGISLQYNFSKPN